ncbi:MAG: asparagine synthase-related protein [Mesorhizobium sp.]
MSKPESTLIARLVHKNGSNERVRQSEILNQILCQFGRGGATGLALCDRRGSHARVLVRCISGNCLGRLVANGFEILDKAAARQGVEPRYPFWDKDLVMFCLALPSEWKLRDGWPRYVLRKAMAGILPESVCWRNSKMDFRGNLARGLVVHHDALINDVLGPGNERIASFVNMDCARKSYRNIKNDPLRASLQDIQNVWRSVILDRWLGQLDASGVSI